MAGFGSSNNGNDAPLCANNCGFYGYPMNRNLCSLCYAAFLKETGENSERQENSNHQIREEEPNLRKRRSPWAGQSSETSEPVADLHNPANKTKIRCKICKKKIGMLGFNCRCGGPFCCKHRHPEEHSCNVDHKAIGRQILAKHIVECKADKLEFRV